jgi:glycosyltransferase involved in cell wall biosynthesis
LEFNTNRTPIYYLSNAVNHLQEILRIIKREAIDVIVAGNLLPPFLLELYKRFSRLKLPLIFDLQDYYPTSAAGYLCNVHGLSGTVVKGFFEGMTQTLLKMADAVTVPGFALATYARTVRGKTGSRQVYVVPNGISEYFLKTYDGSHVREKFGYDEEDLVVGYVGSIEFWLDMKTLIRALSKAYREGFKVKFLLVGGRLQTAYVENTMNWIKDEGIEHITGWINFVEHEKVPEYVAAMDVGTIPFDVKNPTAYYAAPNKLWEYLSQGVNVVSTPIPEALLYSSLLNMAGSEDEYVAALKKVKREENARNCRRNKVVIYLKRRTWSVSAEKIKKIIRNFGK